MAAPTYLDLVYQQFAAAGDAVNAHLVAEGLAPLVTWFNGQPKPLRQAGTPYAWWEHLRAGDSQDRRELGTSTEFRVEVAVCLAMGAPNADQLTRLACAYVPHITAAVEAQSTPYVLLSEGWDKVGEEQGEHFGLYACVFRVEGQRARGGVS